MTPTDGFWYLAIPYTGQQHGSFNAVSKLTVELIKDGWNVFSPITHSHILEHDFGLDLPHDGWLEQDRPFVKACDGLIVYMRNGWKESVGVQREIAWAKQLSKPIYYLTFDIETGDYFMVLGVQ